MADNQPYYHGQGGPHGNSANPNSPYQPGSPQFQPPITSSPYAQPSANYNAPGQGPYGSPLVGGPAPYQQPQDSGYFQPPGAAPQDSSLAAQMGGLGLGEITTHGKKKKKERHAYHTLEAPSGSPGTFNSSPLVGAPSSPYLNADSSAMSSQGQFLGQASPSQTSHFPASVNAPFNPLNPATPGEFASRTGGSDVDFSANLQASGQGRVDPDQIPSVPR
jgi:protein transport protein SEC24